MAQRRQDYKRTQSKFSSNAAYVSGSAVKKLYVQQPLQQPEADNEAQIERRVRRKRENAQIHRANKLNFLYTISVSLVVGVIFGICFQYLNLQTSVKNNASEISQLEAKYNSLKESNDELEAEINAGIDLDAIYDTAVNELGMVYPSKSQVLNYDSGESEYVIQYQDIPADK